MISAKYSFPKGFLWGTATSAHQVEGNNQNNNWAKWEEEGHILDRQHCGLACDWWGGRWKEDFDRAAEASQNTHRFSIEWSRIQPSPDQWDEDALDYYRELAKGLHQRGMKPLVTLHHFTDPLWLTEMGGWENPAVIEKFAAFTSKAINALKQYVDFWCTINEPNVYTIMGYIMGTFPPGVKDSHRSFQVIVNMVSAHAAAYEQIHLIQPNASVGMAINYRSFMPARKWFPFDKWMANIHAKNFNDVFTDPMVTGLVKYLFTKKSVPKAKGTMDYLGINYYSRDLVAFSPFAINDFFAKRFNNPNAALSETGFIANEPQGLYEALKWGSAYKMPVYITENGIEDSKDTLRPRYISEHIHQLWHAVNFNWLIKGYYHWTLVDNFEWERGWSQRFGLWELDPATQIRRKRPSADLFASICKSNALSSEAVAQYSPESFDILFPK